MNASDKVNTRSKGASPSKRKWYSICNQFLKSVNQPRLQEFEVEFLDQATKKYQMDTLLSKTQAILDQTDSLGSYSTVEQLLEEAEYFGLPADTLELLKLKELNRSVASVKREVDMLLESQEPRKIEEYILTLIKVVQTGLMFESAEDIKKILVLNSKIHAALNSKISSKDLESLITEAEANPVVSEQGVLQDLVKRRALFKDLTQKAEELLNLSQISLIDESTLRNTIVNILHSNLEFAQIGQLFNLIEVFNILRGVEELLSEESRASQEGAMAEEGKASAKGKRSRGKSSAKKGNMAIEEPDVDDDGLIADERISQVNRYKNSELSINQVLASITINLSNLDQRVDEVSHAAGKLESRIRESFKKSLGGFIKQLSKLIAKVELDDNELSLLINRAECLIWKNDAKQLLGKNQDDEKALIKVLSKAPQEIITEGSKEYSALKDKV